MSRETLGAAKQAKNDEYYTPLYAVEEELKHYTQYFNDKIVYCNCDNPVVSKFYDYFVKYFLELNLKKLIVTYYDEKKFTYKIEYEREGFTNKCKATPLSGNGDFRSSECIELLKEADIVVTNPPFSLFIPYVKQLIEYNKKFIIVGSMTAIGYNDIFPLIKDNKIWLGYTSPQYFITPEGETKKFGNILWYTNCEIEKRNNPLPLSKKYSPENYSKFDNFDIINVDRTANIPMDYNGLMDVPISFLTKYCPHQFEIIDCLKKVATCDSFGTNAYLRKNKLAASAVNGKEKFTRLVIKRK